MLLRNKVRPKDVIKIIDQRILMENIRGSKGVCVLLGGGAGGSELLTLEGKKWLQRADVVVYDRLICNDILNFVPQTAWLAYVGKDPENHPIPQSEINRILVEKTLEGNIVVRLKGGDPFIFGRGGEEARALIEAGCDFRVIPGITAATVAGAYAGISLTDRSCASSVAFITGHEDPSKDVSSIDYKSLAGIDTLVFYMGIGRLGDIAAELISAGKSSDTPVAVVQNAGLGRQRTITATLETIADKVKEENITPPAVVIVGQTADMSNRLEWFDKLPLAGQSVLVTRSRSQAGKLSQLLREYGGDVTEFPTIEITAPDEWNEVDNAIGQLGQMDYVAFTSPNGAEFFLSRILEIGRDMREFAGVKIAVIGKATGEKLMQFGLRYDLMPDEFTSQVLGDLIAARASAGDRVMLVRSDIAPRELEDRLLQEKLEIFNIRAYKTTIPHHFDTDDIERLKSGNFDWLTFTSASTVENFRKILESPELESVSKSISDIKIAAIGPVTAQAAENGGLKVKVIACEHTIPGLVDTMAEYCHKLGKCCK